MILINSSNMTIYLKDKFDIGNKIGGGSFGEIFHAKNKKTDEDVAAKLETITLKDSKSQLRREAKIYYMLDGSVGIPRVRWFGDLGDKYVLVMDLLGKSLEDLFNYCNRKFSLKTVLVLAYEMISRIQTVHTKGLLIHRDIKPENFLMGRGRERHTVFIIDFGLAKHHTNPQNKQHITCHDGHSLTGTARYASVNAQQGYDQSRKDDLISVGYVLMYFLKGSLPWQGLQTTKQQQQLQCNLNNHPHNAINNNTITNEDKYSLILDKKRNTTAEELCARYPAEFRMYFEHVNSLSFEDVPDYIYLKRLFKDLFIKMKYEYSQILFDWEIIAYEKQQKSNKNESM